jgi:hypothetical protein
MKFYSETLDKMFDSEAALVAAEETAKKAALEKEQKVAAKKAEAKVVEDAFKAYNAAKTAFNTNMVARRKKYAEDLAALKNAYDTAVEEDTKKLDAAANTYNNSISEFTKKHPEGFHMTLKDGDNVVSLHSKGSMNMDTNIKSMLNDKWFDSFFNLFKI